MTTTTESAAGGPGTGAAARGTGAPGALAALTELSMTVGGAALAGAGGLEVIDPATAEAFATAPAADRDQLDTAMAAAQGAFDAWRRDDDARRAALLAAADVLAAALPTLATTLTAEQGKPLAEARAEIAGACLWLRYYAGVELRPEVVQDDSRGYARITRNPLGVVAAIAPWNFPVALGLWKVAPALRAGNTVVLKPSPDTPLTTLAVGELLRPVLPAGVFNVVSGPDPLGAWLAAHPLARRVSFTGATATGRKVLAASVDDLKRVSLELGGNDPAIVLPDADPARIAEGLFWGAFRNNGQFCLAVKRVYVHRRRHAELVEALAALAGAAVVGPGHVDGVQLGPLTNVRQFRRVTELVGDAVHHGATVAAGGGPLDRPGYFHEPTVLTGVEDGVRIVDEEQFGPALPIVVYDDVDDAVARANGTSFGLTASVWSSDLDHATAVAARLDCGQVCVNAHGAGLRPDLPFGGHRWSGLGVENGRWGLESFTEPQVLVTPARPAANPGTPPAAPGDEPPAGGSAPGETAP
ncbi:betaine-aldehyde dehydrogenase [Pseudofrankia asymbiotica]|uniref:Betaine-aldehyde dehydrogenase n=1 Tax=Pseudofrankia asymbiotica TaxID=1834516 RepID=A0A1V2IEW5_9ACTN|nr:aldehyde dehydrogenase family protein [Pseudofrankia asymbiotica]ONH31742.1 betaine-aldehyde dehydrogenase [Pseudofrankia asymbiotica]